MDGKPLAVCGVCGCDPCDCHGALHMEFVRLTYKVNGHSFTLDIPKRLVDSYKSLYEEIEVMQSDGSVVVYSRGAVVKNEDNKESYK